VVFRCVLLFRDFHFEDEVAVYMEDNLSEEAGAVGPFMHWLESKRLPALIPARRDTERFFLKDIETRNGLVILFGGDQEVARGLHQLAVKFKQTEGRLKWVRAEGSDEFVEGLGRSVNIDVPGDFPELVLWEFGETEDDDKVYRLSKYAGVFPTEEFVGLTKSFVDSWRAGKLTTDSTLASSSAGAETADQASSVSVDPVKPKEKSKKRRKKAAADPKKPKVVPCPVDGNINTCSDWCRESSPGPQLKLVGTLGGKACKDWSPDDPPYERPTCSCYDEAFTDVMTSCQPSCATTGAKASKTLPSLPDTCAAGDASCQADRGDQDDDLLADF